jgi:HSP20 family protein
MALVRFDPFRQLEEISNRWGAFGPRQATLAGDVDTFGDWTPAMDVQESDTEFLVKTDLPDVPRDQIKVGIENGVLTIEGERRQERDEKTKHYHRLERSYGSFMRRMTVPPGVDDTKVSADFKNGVLAVHLPKSAGARSRGVNVAVG